MPRTGSLAGTIGKEALHDAVLERMERDDDETSAGLQRCFRRKQRLGEFAEFIIDEDAQRLEDARRGMDLVLGLARRDDLDEAGQIARRLERLFRPPLLDGAGNAPRLLFLAEKAENTNEIADLGAIDDIGSTHAGSRHAHVERPIPLERKTALGLVDLHGGDADIEHHAIEPSTEHGRPDRKTGNG